MQSTYQLKRENWKYSTTIDRDNRKTINRVCIGISIAIAIDCKHTNNNNLSISLDCVNLTAIYNIFSIWLNYISNLSRCSNTKSISYTRHSLWIIKWTHIMLSHWHLGITFLILSLNVLKSVFIKRANYVCLSVYAQCGSIAYIQVRAARTELNTETQSLFMWREEDAVLWSSQCLLFCCVKIGKIPNGKLVLAELHELSYSAFVAVSRIQASMDIIDSELFIPQSKLLIYKYISSLVILLMAALHPYMYTYIHTFNARMCTKEKLLQTIAEMCNK